MFFFLCKNANLESTCAVFAISSRYVASRHVTSHRIASHHIASQRGWNASGGGSATSVAARCSKTGPLRMRASSLLHRARRCGKGEVPPPNPNLPYVPTRRQARQSRESLRRVEVSPRAPRALPPLSLFLSLSHIHALPRPSSPSPEPARILERITATRCNNSYTITAVVSECRRCARNRDRDRVITAKKLVISECTWRHDAAR